MLSSRLLRVAALTVFASLSPLSVTVAQDEAPAYAATTTQDPKIDVEILQRRLRPLRQAEAEAELAAWWDLVEAKATELAGVREAQLLADDAGNADRSKELIEQASSLRDERGELMTRMAMVAEMAKGKGSDVTEAELWLGQVNAAPPIRGFQSALQEVKVWVMSPTGGVALLLNIVKFLAVLFIFKILGGMVSNLLGRAVKRMPQSSDLLHSFVVNTSRKLIVFIGLVIALSYIGVNIAPLVAALGAAGFIIGFALQGTLGNFAAGVMVLIYRPFDIGDVVSAAGVTGKVDSMNLVSTSVKTPDNQTIIVPNGTIWGDVITNITANPTRRVDLVFGCGYGDDLDKVKAVLREETEAHPLVLKDPAVTVEVSELADSSVNFICRPWCKTSDYWDIYWGLQMQMKQRFDKEGISIPFPQRDVHMHEVKAD